MAVAKRRHAGSRRGAGSVAPARALPAAAVDGGRRTVATALLIFAVSMVIYAANFRTLAAGDSLPTRLLPFSILREGNLDLNEFSWEMRRDGRPPYYLRMSGDRVYSGSPVALPIVIAPLYVLPAWYLAAHDISYDDVRARVVIVMMERISAAVLAAASASLLFVVLQHLTTRRAAMALTAVYALGTSTWSISSQALWPHGLSELCLTVVTWIFLRGKGESVPWAVVAGLVALLAVANRPPMVVFAALAFLYMWQCHRHRVLAFAALPIVGGVGVLAYNLAVYRRLTGGYGVQLASFAGNVATGVAGLLISPNRGLLVYTPLLAFGFWGALRVWREPAPVWMRYLTVGIAGHLLVYGQFAEWWGGYTYGPRYMTDLLPALVLLLVYGLVPLWSRTGVRVVATLLALYGVAVQALGAYAADDDWNRTPARIELRPDRLWDWDDLQIMRAVHNGWHGTELAEVMIDAFRDPTPALLAPLGENELRGELQATSLPTSMPRGATSQYRVQVTNRSEAAWPAFSGDGVMSARYVVFVLARWFQRGEPLPGAGDVAALPENLAPGETASVAVTITAPSRPGDYELDLRITQARDAMHGAIGPQAMRVPITVR